VIAFVIPETGRAIEQGGSDVRCAVESAFAESAIRGVDCSGSPEPFDEARIGPDWNAHGRLTSDQHRAVVDMALREVVVPCMRGLLANARARSSTRRRSSERSRSRGESVS
jgi:hypothetical protein